MQPPGQPGQKYGKNGPKPGKNGKNGPKPGKNGKNGKNGGKNGKNGGKNGDNVVTEADAPEVIPAPLAFVAKTV